LTGPAASDLHGGLGDELRVAEPALHLEDTSKTLHRILHSPRVVLGVHLSSLVIGFVVLLYLERNQWFFFDEWDFISYHVGQGSQGGLFTPHNEHWSTLPILAYQLLLHVFGLHTYTPYIALLLLLHVVLAHLLWRWMIRSGADPWLATALAVVFLAIGAGAENLTWAFQIGFVGAVVLGFVALFLVDRDGPFRWREIAVWLVLVLALMCSGIGVDMAVVVALAALIRRGWRTALTVAAVPAAVYLVWFATAARGHGVVAAPTETELLNVPAFAWRGLTGTVDQVTGLTGIGVVALVGLVILLVRYSELARTALAVTYATAIGAVVFYLITGIGRIHFGLDEALSSRYEYIAAALLLLGASFGLSKLGRRSLVARATIFVLVGAAFLHGSGLLIDQSRSMAGVKQASKDQILAAADLLHGGAAILADQDARPDPQVAPQLSLGVLRALDSEGALPSHGALSHQAQIGAALQLMVSVTEAPALPPEGQPMIGGTVGTGAVKQVGGCASFISGAPGSSVRLLWSGPASVSITSTQGGTLGLQYATRDQQGVLTASRDFTLRAGSAAYLNISTGDAAPLLTLPSGLDEICGLA
jgi:hypothetical protein